MNNEIQDDTFNKGSGIYALVNNTNGHKYIGSAVNFRLRYLTHLSHLKCQRHHSKILQNAWNKYGENSFKFSILEKVDNKNDLIIREQIWLDKEKPEYNICDKAGSVLGIKRRKESIEKGRIKRIGQRRSLYSCSKMSEVQKKLFLNGYIHPNKGRKLGTDRLEEMKKIASKAILQYDVNGNFIKEWPSAKEAGKVLGISSNGITAVCVGRKHYKTAAGFVWKHKPISDPYISLKNCVKRLEKEYIKHRKLIVATDFDFTVWSPSEQDSHIRVIELLKECSNLGFLIVIYTAAIPERFDMMKNFLEEKGIKIASINKNPIELPFGNHGKIYYNILLDDRAGLSSAYKILSTLVKKIKNNLIKTV